MSDKDQRKNIWKAGRIMCGGKKEKRLRRREKIEKERWRTERGRGSYKDQEIKERMTHRDRDRAGPS